MSKRCSVLSVDSNPDYLFFVPITCAFWKKLEYDPYVILVEKEISEDIKRLVLETTEAVKANAHFNFFDHIDGYRTCNVAQVSRLYAAADEFFADDDYLITDDMDKFVVNYMWFNQQNPTKDIHIFDPDELNYTRLKIGNIGMNASVWKEIIGIEPTSVRDNVVKCFDKHLAKDSSWDTGWNLDEWILTKRVFDSPYYPDQCQMCERGANKYGLRTGRIDRTAWPQTFSQYINFGLIDVHLHRDPYEDKIWEDTKIIMKQVFTDAEIEIFQDYKEKFVELIEKK
jgi:hypothetical protein